MATKGEGAKTPISGKSPADGEKEKTKGESGLKKTLEFLEDKVGIKRGHYKRLECPYCHKVKGNLKNHIAQAHPNESAERAEESPALDREVLTGEKKAGEIERPASPEKTIYYCNDCKAEIRKGETECWNCHANLNWEGIE